MKFKGKFKVVHRDKSGKVKGKYAFNNGVVNVGIDMILDAMFHGGSASGTWYIGLIDADGYSAIAAGDTMSSHAGWTELTTYSEATREEWLENAASGQEITTATPAQFSINADNSNIKGLFIIDDNTKGGSAGTLWSTALFDSTIDLGNGDTLDVEYEIAGK